MNGLTRTPVADLQPGDVARTHRTAKPFKVVSTLLEHGASWRVLGHDGITRHYAARATVVAGGPDPTGGLFDLGVAS